MARLSTEERQKHIIDEAINIIHENGYQSLSIRELSDRVGISEPAIYRHFLNKEDIILGILSRFAEFDNQLLVRIKEFEKPTEKINHFINFHFTFLEKNPEFTSVLFSEDIFNQSPLLKEKMMLVIGKRKRILKEIVEDGKAKGNVTDIDTNELLTLILGFIRLIVMEWRLSNFSFSLRERGKKAAQVIEKLIFI
jgi:AcrR family transcriptional regulator